MKNVLRYSVLGLLAFLGSLLLLAPATMVIDPLTEQFRGLTVQTVEGDATDGVANGINWRGVQIDQLNWDWRTDDPDIKLAGKAAINPARYRRLRDFTGNLRLTELAIAAGQPKWPVQGVVDFNLREVRLNPAGQPLAADGVVHLLNLRVTLGQPLALGDFTAQLTPADPEGVQGVIQDHDSPLALEGTFNLLPDGRYRFNGQASVRDPNNNALRQAMNLLGPPGGDGRWTLNFSGVLPR